MLADELSKLRELHDAGELSDEEYSAAKAQLLKQPKALMQPKRPDSDGLGGMTPSTYATVLHLSHYGGLMLPFAGFVIPIGMWLYAKTGTATISVAGDNSKTLVLLIVATKNGNAPEKPEDISRMKTVVITQRFSGASNEAVDLASKLFRNTMFQQWLGLQTTAPQTGDSPK